MSASSYRSSPLIYGCMGLGGAWDNAPITREQIKQTHRIIDTALENGITTFDHADIYTLGKAEQVFGKALAERPELRSQLQIQSKCAIRFADEQGGKRYDLSKNWIVNSTEQILSRLGIDQLDSLLLHRPDPLMEPEVIADTLAKLQAEGKIKHVGVSNMNAPQMALIQSALNTPIVCNQQEISLGKLDWLEEGITSYSSTTLGSIEYCRSNDVQIQAWGSASQGLFSGRDVSNQADSIQKTAHLVANLATEYQVAKEAIVLAWLMRHPANIAPVIGSTNLQRIQASAQATQITLSREQWYQLYESARGHELP